MGVSSDSISIDIDNVAPLGGKEVCVKTSKGSISVFVCGDQQKPALITYPDVALNCSVLDLRLLLDVIDVLTVSSFYFYLYVMSCFRGLFFCQEAASLLLHNFCIYHIDAPGHELGAGVISSDVPLLSVHDLADQVAEVVDFFGLEKVFCLGVTAGAYILTLFAIKYEERVAALILVSPLCREPSWTEWIYNQILLNLLYFYGMCGLLKECLLLRYFSKELRRGMHGTESDVVHYCRRLLDERQSLNVMRFLRAINERHDITEGLQKLQCKALIFVGERSPFHADSLHMNTIMNKKACALVEVESCGSLVTEELPYAMLVPIEFFLMGFGFQSRTPFASTESNGALSKNSSRHWCIAPELLSSESLGIKLKPIKTRPTTKT